jgi:hypothetical protein
VRASAAPSSTLAGPAAASAGPTSWPRQFPSSTAGRVAAGRHSMSAKHGHSIPPLYHFGWRVERAASRQRGGLRVLTERYSHRPSRIHGQEGDCCTYHATRTVSG